MDVKLKAWLILGLLLGTAVYAIAEDITLTTYYPSPRGVYQELRTAGNVQIGTINPPAGIAPRLHVVQDQAAPALRVDDEDAPGDTTPFVISDTGNVGIGTASPGSKLTVTGTIESSADGVKFPDSTVQTTASPWDASATDIYNTNTGNVGIGTVNPDHRLHVVQDDPASAVPVFRADDETSETSPFIIDATGNVGIGTVNPDHRLHVAGDAVVEGGQVQLGNRDSDPAAIGDGAIYYNTTSGTFRGSMAGTWGDLGLGPIWDSGCFAISTGGTYPFTHDLGSTPRFVLVYGSNSADCSSAGIMRHMDNNSLSSGGYALYPITPTQVTLRISLLSWGNDICSHDHPGCSDTAATHARIILMR